MVQRRDECHMLKMWKYLYNPNALWPGRNPKLAFFHN